MNFNLYDYQKTAVEKMHNGCILCGGVGSGKSRTALAYFVEKECCRGKRMKPLYVITTARKRDTKDWEDEASYFGIGDVEGSRCKMVVDSWNNLHKYAEEMVSGSFFIFDEQRVVGSGAWVKSFLKITKLNRWVLLSATPGDSWMDYIPVFVANGFYRNKTHFLTQHVVFSRFTKYPKVDKYINCDRLIECKNKVVVMMPFERKTTSHHVVVPVDYDYKLMMQVFRGRWNPYKNQPVTQAGDWCYTMRKVANSDRSRVEALIDICEEHPRVIVFYNFDYELEILRDALNDYFLYPNENSVEATVAEYNGHRHDEVPTTERWIYLVQYTAGSEAWNCVTTDTTVFYSLNYSYKAMEQASGRINRSNTPYYDLYYYVFKSESPIDRSIITALKNKKDFNANRFYTKNQNKFEEQNDPVEDMYSQDYFGVR